MTTQFKVIFTHYNKEKAQRSISEPVFTNVANFPDAFNYAHAMIRGMKALAADGDDFEIVSIEAIGYTHQNTKEWRIY